MFLDCLAADAHALPAAARGIAEEVARRRDMTRVVKKIVADAVRGLVVVVSEYVGNANDMYERGPSCPTLIYPALSSLSSD